MPSQGVDAAHAVERRAGHKVDIHRAERGGVVRTVAAEAAVQEIVAGAADEDVVAVAGRQEVDALRPDQRVVAAQTDERVAERGGGAVEQVAEVGAGDLLDVGQRVGAQPGGGRVKPPAALATNVPPPLAPKS